MMTPYEVDQPAGATMVHLAGSGCPGQRGRWPSLASFANVRVNVASRPTALLIAWVHKRVRGTPLILRFEKIEGRRTGALR